jgi:N4-gp56 family major capsid protein
VANTISNATNRANIWLKELHQDVIDSLYFKQRNMMGTDANNIVQIKDELKKQQGDRVTFGLTMKLAGGVTGDSELEGAEAAITSYGQACIIDQIRNAVRLTGRLDEQKVAYNMREDAKDQLAKWKQEFIERQIFMKLGGVTNTALTDVNSVVYSQFATWSNSPNVVPTADEDAGTGARYLCTDSVGLDSLQTTDILTTAFITRARVKAKLASPAIQPIRVDGQDFYVMFIHPWQAADLKTAASSVWAQAQREAQVRGDKNPIFTGSLGIWDGVILHEHEYVPTAVATAKFDSAGQAAGARAFRSILTGRQAVVMAECEDPNGWVEETFDYQNKVGFSTGLIGGIQKTAFNSVDYGTIIVDSGATNLA